MARKKSNDQGEIIEHLKNAEYMEAWEKVKSIGFREVPDISERFLVFSKAASKFDPYKNNNFILFFRSYLKYGAMAVADAAQYKLTTNRSVINQLKSHNCSPKEELPPLVEEIAQFIG